MSRVGQDADRLYPECMPLPKFPSLDDKLRIARLSPPSAPRSVRMVLDTDTANEIDDQFAVVHALLSGDRLSVEAIYAAPFARRGTAFDNPAAGVEESEAEIHRLLERLRVDPAGRVLRGADRFLAAVDSAVPNAASNDLIERAMATSDGDVLWVAAIGALPNIASALLLAPEIVERIAVVWLGGQPLHWHTADEYNLRQDPDALRVVLACGVPFVYVPCYGAASHLLTTTAELDAYVRPQGAIGEYLADIFRDHDEQYPGRSKEIWDLAAIAHLLDESWTPRRTVSRPSLGDDLTWGVAESGASIGAVDYVQRDPIFADLFAKLGQFESGDRQAGFALDPRDGNR